MKGEKIIFLITMIISFIKSIILQVIILCFLGWLLCDIQPDKYYSWYYGIWHGLFMVANFVRSLIFDDVLFKAVHHTNVYSVFYWIFGVISIYRLTR